MNSTTQTGNLTREPELKFLNSGTPSVRFSIAVNRRWQNKQTQEWEEATSFFDVTAYGALAENVANSFTRGDRVIVTGRLEQRSWETPEGDKRSVTEIVADEIGASISYATVSITKTAKPGERPSSPSKARSAAPDYSDDPF